MARPAGREPGDQKKLAFRGEVRYEAPMGRLGGLGVRFSALLLFAAALLCACMPSAAPRAAAPFELATVSDLLGRAAQLCVVGHVEPVDRARKTDDLPAAPLQFPSESRA